MLNQDQKISLVYKQILNGYEDVNLFALLIKYGLFFFEKNKLLCLKINNHEYFFKKEIFEKIHTNDENVYENFKNNEINNNVAINLDDLPNIKEKNIDELLKINNENAKNKNQKNNNNQNKQKQKNNNQKNDNKNNNKSNNNNNKKFNNNNKNVTEKITIVNEAPEYADLSGFEDNLVSGNDSETTLNQEQQPKTKPNSDNKEQKETKNKTNVNSDNSDNEEKIVVDKGNNTNDNHSDDEHIAIANEDENEKEENNKLNVLTDDDEDLLTGNLIDIEDDNDTDNSNYYVKLDDLLYEKYIVKYTEKQKDENDKEIDVEKQYEIFICPIDFEKNQMSLIPIFALAKFDDNLVCYVSLNRKRPSIQGKMKDNSFSIRGRVNENDFETLFYPQNIHQQPTAINIEKYEPKNFRSLGHTLIHYDDLKFHVLPLSNKNNNLGKVNILVCLEDEKNNRFLVECTKDNAVQINYQNTAYRITAQWKNDILVANVTI
jgi:putative mediator of RNA polymerase II transcription subunit 24